VLPLAGVKDQVDSQIVALARPQATSKQPTTVAQSVAVAL
jgi:hypothetical protein